jgi:hypothetical protein
VSGPAPKTYVLESVFIALAILVGLVLFLKSQWSGH